MSNYITMLGGIGYIEILVFLGILAIIGFIIVGVKMRRTKSVIPSLKPVEQNPSGEHTDREGNKDEDKPSLPYGYGEYKAYLYYDIYFQPTRIPEPIGNLMLFDPSMEISGGLYLVKLTEDNKLAAYVPYQSDYNAEETPQRAYRATHGWKELIHQAMDTPANWWQSLNSWLAVGVLVILFVAVLTAVGG